MLKIVSMLMLLTLIASPIIATSTDNTSANNRLNNSLLNNSVLNNTSLNDTRQNDLGIDSSLFNWFAKPTKQKIALNLDLVLGDIKSDYLRDAIDIHNPGEVMTESDFSRLANPPAIGDGRVKYSPEDEIGDPDPECDSEDCMDPWIKTPPWEVVEGGDDLR